jgi:hypothetical protein
MLFDLWVLCLIVTGLGMFLVSVLGDALSHLRQHWQERHTHLEPIDSPGAPIGWGH